MRVLLDECLPKRLKSELKEHAVTTVPEAGWSGKKNGDLLRLAEGRFDVFLTGDQNLTYQQNLRDTNMAVLVLAAESNRFGTLKPLMPKVREALRTIRPKQAIRISA